MAKPIFTRIDLRIGTRHLSLSIADARAIYETLKTLFEPENFAPVHHLFDDDKLLNKGKS